MSQIMEGLTKKEILKLKKKYGDKYKKFIYYVEKEISVEDNIYAKNYNLLGYRMYIILNRTNHYRFFYMSSKKLFVDTEILGKSLNFIKHSHYEPLGLKFFLDIFGEKQVGFIEKESDEIPKYLITPNDILVKEINDPNLREGEEPKKKYVFPKNIHSKRIAFDNVEWYKDELKDMNFDSLNKKIIKDILEGAIIDERIEKVLISEFFELPQIYDVEEGKSIDYMKNNTHSIVLSQGSTGKSSILCLLGNDLTKTSDAGMFGYMDVTNNSWRAGEVSKTKKAIIVDEINEIIDSNAKKGESVLDTLNTPLENGKFNYGKAGGMKVNFGNQFIFLGNIRDNFHFENFVNGLSSNQSTMGRRFCYLVYDDKLNWKNGNQRDITKHIHKIQPLREFLSNVLLYFLKNKKFIDKKINNNIDFMNLIEKDKNRLLDIIRPIEHPNTRQFLKTFSEYSLVNRVPIMALKLTIFEYLGEFLKIESLEKFSYAQNNFMTRYLEIYKGIIIDLEHSFKNILSHQNESIIVDSELEIMSKRLNRELNNNQKLLIFRLGQSNNELNIKFAYKNITIKGRLKYIKRDLLNKGLNPKDRILNKYGIFPKIEAGEVFFTINKNQFKQAYIICDKNKKDILTKAGESEFIGETEVKKEVEVKEVETKKVKIKKEKIIENFNEVEVISMEDEIVKKKDEDKKDKSEFDIDEILMDDDLL